MLDRTRKNHDEKRRLTLQEGSLSVRGKRNSRLPSQSMSSFNSINNEDSIYMDNDEIYGRLQRNFSEIFDAISIKTATNGTFRRQRNSHMIFNDDSDIYEDNFKNFELTDDLDSYSIKTATYGVVKNIRKRSHVDQSQSSADAGNSEPIYEAIEMETIDQIQREMQEGSDSGSQSGSDISDANTFTCPSSSSSEDEQFEEEVPSNSIQMTSLRKPEFKIGTRRIHSNENDPSDSDNTEVL